MENYALWIAFWAGTTTYFIRGLKKWNGKVEYMPLVKSLKRL